MKKYKSLKWKNTNLSLVSDVKIVSSGYSDRFVIALNSINIEHINGCKISKQYSRYDVLNADSVHGLICTFNWVENSFENRLKIEKMIRLLQCTHFIKWEYENYSNYEKIDLSKIKHILYYVANNDTLSEYGRNKLLEEKNLLNIDRNDKHFKIVQYCLNKIDIKHNEKNKNVLNINVLNSYFQDLTKVIIDTL